VGIPKACMEELTPSRCLGQLADVEEGGAALVRGDSWSRTQERG
jgi:hypothetical protein